VSVVRLKNKKVLLQAAEKGERSRLCERSEAIQTTFPKNAAVFALFATDSWVASSLCSSQ
jgi:hypothetical protein